MRDILADVAERHGVSVADLKGPRVIRQIAWARQEFCWLARQEGRWSLPLIGSVIDRDHTTVMHAIRAHAKRVEAPPTTDSDAGFVRQDCGVPPIAEACSHPVISQSR